MKARSSGLTTSACVVHMPCGKPWWTLRVPFLRSFAESSAESAIGTIWSSSPCITNVGTSMIFRSSIKSLSESPDAIVLRFRTAHHGLPPPVLDNGLGHLRARPVVAVEGAAREFPIELRAVGGELLPETVKYLDRQAARIGWRLHHDRRHGADEHQLGDTALAVARDIVRRFAAAGRMANVDGVAQIEMRDDRGGVRGVVVHVVTIADLARPAMAASVMRNDAVALLQEVEHLGVPVVSAERPAMMEDDGLRVPGSPVLVVDRRTILH